MTKRSDPCSQTPKRKHYKADYKGATPRQVAEAVLRYRRPEEPKNAKPKRAA